MLKRGISGVELRKMTGISEASITNIKYGSDLYLSTAKAIAKALNTKIDYIWPD
jgi:DNA-binding Xre family transcriptional regulator